MIKNDGTSSFLFHRSIERTHAHSAQVGPLDAVRWGNLAKTLEELDLSGNANLEGRLEALPPFDPDAPAPFKVGVEGGGNYVRERLRRLLCFFFSIL